MNWSEDKWKKEVTNECHVSDQSQRMSRNAVYGDDLDWDRNKFKGKDTIFSFRTIDCSVIQPNPLKRNGLHPFSQRTIHLLPLLNLGLPPKASSDGGRRYAALGGRHSHLTGNSIQ